ncbi:UNVERIFIED_CONTAM: hypothetical protein GTU68_047561 [Idotea baltica]|nr:hypothetical protein [Idotea baltica]
MQNWLWVISVTQNNLPQCLRIIRLMPSCTLPRLPMSVSRFMHLTSTIVTMYWAP